MGNPLLDLNLGIGFGAVQLSGAYPWEPAPDRANAIAVVRRAVELGVRLIDTADSYGIGHNEELIGEALAPLDTDGVLIATKSGQARPSVGEWIPCGRPEYIRQQAELSLIRLRTERIDLYQLHRLDPTVALEDQIGALRQLQDEGKVAMIGLSQVTGEQLARAMEITPIVSIQNRYSLAHQGDAALAEHCASLGVAFLPWGPLEIDDGVRPAVEQVAAAHDATPQQVALAWLRRHPNVIPIPGTKSVAHLESNLAAPDLRLTDDEVALLSATSESRVPMEDHCA